MQTMVSQWDENTAGRIAVATAPVLLVPLPASFIAPVSQAARRL